jgi:3-dehydroquinate synthase
VTADRSVSVGLGARSYEILIGRELPVGGALCGEEDVRALVVTDSHVGPLYGRDCLDRLRAAGIDATLVTVPAGEASKSLAQLDGLYNAALDAGLDRRGVIVALGGGVVGDLAGLAAATYLRGVRLIQVPTTLLAMVDSSVGGKTAVDLPRGKNLVGAFHQPIQVVADLRTLGTMAERDYAAGLAEVVKYGAIRDAVFFGRLEADADAILGRDPAALVDVVARCCEIKAEVVGADETEGGLRAILNFGHTLGHALETVDGYGRWRHGEAVSMGMVYAAKVSEAVAGLDPAVTQRLSALLTRFGLPLRPAEPPSWDALRDAMAADKKSRGRVPRFVLAPELGRVEFGCAVPEGTLQAVYGEWVAR